MILAMKRLHKDISGERAALALQTMAEQDQQNSSTRFASDMLGQTVKQDELTTPKTPLTVYPY